MKLYFSILLLISLPLFSQGQSAQFSKQQYKEDFNYFWNSINDEYCYFNKKQTQWQKVKEIYSPALDSISSRSQFVSIIEKALNEIYDHHAILNTNTDSSSRLVPSGTDIWAAYEKGIPLIIELRKGFGAATAGIRAGMEIIAINDVPVEKAVERLLPRSLKSADNEAKSFALRLALAGNHVLPRKLTLRYNGTTTVFYPDKNGMQLEQIRYNSIIESHITGNIGYIKINDCLYSNGLIPAFDSVMQLMQHTKALVLDLRETPSGGSTTVARAILSWFISSEKFYQKHEYYAEENELGIKRSWEEIVSPRKNKYYSKPLAILCNHWTGSIAEGITIGFDALQRPLTTIIGTAMARLNGAVYSYEMPNTKIHFTFPAERLYHINGLPREGYLPPVTIDVTKDEQTGTDLFITKALEYLSSRK